jgi:hypothetical protein
MDFSLQGRSMNELMLIKGMFTKEFCKEVISREPTSEKIYDAKEGEEDLYGTTLDWSITDNDIIEKLDKLVLSYMKENNLNIVPLAYKHHSSIIQGSYGAIKMHIDLEWERQVDFLTHFTILTSLNGDEVEGGQLIFPRQGETYQFETGDTLVFPIGMFYPHEVLPVTNNVQRLMFKSLYVIDLEKFDQNDSL